MQLKIFDLDFNFLGICEEINDIEWIREFYRGGSFVLNAKMNEHNVGLLQKNRVIIKNNAWDEPMIIEHRQLIESDDGDEELMISGKSLATRILDSRITIKRQIEKDTADKVLENLLLKQTNLSEDTNRHIPNLVIDTSIKEDFTNKIEHSSLYKSLYEDFEEICTVEECGYKLTFKPLEKEFYFEVYKGKDLTSSVLFSIDFDNLKNQTYIDSIDNYKNVAITCGQGEGEDRDMTIINDKEYSGLDRLEVYIDARDIEQDKEIIKDKEGYDTEFPIHNGENAIKLLTNRGYEKLAEISPVNSFDASLVENNYKYKEDFDLGDLVVVRNKNWNVEFNQRITKIIESYDVYGRTITVNFGNELPTIQEKLKQRIKRGN